MKITQNIQLTDMIVSCEDLFQKNKSTIHANSFPLCLLILLLVLIVHFFLFCWNILLICDCVLVRVHASERAKYSSIETSWETRRKHELNVCKAREQKERNNKNTPLLLCTKAMGIVSVDSLTLLIMPKLPIYLFFCSCLCFVSMLLIVLRHLVWACACACVCVCGMLANPVSSLSSLATNFGLY